MYKSSKLFAFFLVCLINLSLIKTVQAEEYLIDTEGAHAFIQFKIKHLGYSWLYGRFNTFSGHFSYDEANPSAAKIELDIDVSSLDSNHAKRDKHLRSDEFLDVKKFPSSKFTSTSYEETADGEAILKGDFTLHGVTKNITINVNQVGHGDDPWGGYRRGFYGTTMIKPSEFGIQGMEKLGPNSSELFLEFSIEGIRQNKPK